MLKILLVDIETAPKKAFVWRMWKENVSTNQLISDWFILTWKAKWLGDSEIYGEKISPCEVEDEDDSRLMRRLWDMLDAADVVVAHNADKFDVPSINTRFLANGMKPPSPYKTVDTLKVAKRVFKISSNRLDYIGEFLRVGRKIDTGGFELWARCMNMEQEAIDEMFTYNEQDVILLEKVYYKLLPYIPHHPSHAVVNAADDLCCTRCGSEKVHRRGYTHTNISTFQRYVCLDCGGWSRARQNIRSKEQMKQTLMPV